jgi:hypothetical protein
MTRVPEPQPTPLPTCSVVLASLHRLTPDKERRLRQLDAQVAELGGELLIGSDTKDEGPPDVSPWRAATWLVVRGAGTFELRRLAVERAHGAVVVISEDHCEHPDGWLAALLASHRAHPEADVIVARVDNASDDTAIDRASFWVNSGYLRPPMDPVRAVRRIPITGASLKRPALERLLSAYPGLALELILPEDLRRHGLRIIVDESFGIAHDQADSWTDHAIRHFHNARAGVGIIRLGRVRTWVRLAAWPVLAVARWAHTLLDARRRGFTLAQVLVMAPAVGWIYCAKAAGEWVGALAGPGDSGTRLE